MKLSIFKSISILYLLTLTANLVGQLCDGNKGENIFKDGDFGSGTIAVVQTNPNIAPGYSYTTGLPYDGYYSITNNTGTWSLFSSWITIKNNSSDPNGYMMVVNASFSPGIFYEKTINDICGNTLYEFSADVINIVKTNALNHIDPNIDFLINDEVRFTTGMIPKTEKWNTYGFTFTAPVNATSVKLTLRNKAPGGIGNDLALDNISFRACGPSAFVGIDPDKAILLCSDDDPFAIKAEITGSANPRIIWQLSRDSINWQEYGLKNVASITHSNFEVGKYYYRYLTAGDDVSILNEKCRVISEVVTVEVLPLEYNVTETICSNQIYNLGDQKINKSGEYQATLVSSRGCDSIIYLKLNVINPEVIYDEYHELCNHGIEISLINFNGPYDIMVNNDPATLVNSLPYRLQLQVGVDNDIAVKSKDGCISELSIQLPDPMEVVASLDTTYISTNIYQLNIKSDTNPKSIQWTTNGQLDCVSCLSPKIRITEDTNVKVDLVFENGCKLTLSTKLIYKALPSFTFPNIFSPNGDGNNDIFYIKYADDNIVIKRFQIFDRWGSLIFSKQNTVANDILNGWDGTFNGKEIGTGVYQFVVDAEDTFGFLLGAYSGSITLVR